LIIKLKLFVKKCFYNLEISNLKENKRKEFLETSSLTLTN
jgi:hypothetical protein